MKVKMYQRYFLVVRLPFWTEVTDHLHLPGELLLQLHLGPGDVPLEGCEDLQVVAALNTDEGWVASLPVSLQVQADVEELLHPQNNLRLLLQAEDCKVSRGAEPAQLEPLWVGVVPSLDSQWTGQPATFPFLRSGAGSPGRDQGRAGWVVETSCEGHSSPPSSATTASPGSASGGEWTGRQPGVRVEL